MRSFVICSWPFSEQGELKHHDGACLLQSYADCENWPENSVGAKCMALKLFFSSPDWHLWMITSPCCGLGVEMDWWWPSIISDVNRFSKKESECVLLPRGLVLFRSAFFDGHLKHIQPLSHLNGYLLTFQGIPNLKGETWHGVSVDVLSSTLGSIQGSELDVFLSHWQFCLFQVMLLSPTTLAVSQRCGNLNDKAAPSCWPPAPCWFTAPAYAWWWSEYYVQIQRHLDSMTKLHFVKILKTPKWPSCWPFPSLYVLSLAKPFKYPFSQCHHLPTSCALLHLDCLIITG